MRKSLRKVFLFAAMAVLAQGCGSSDSAVNTAINNGQPQAEPVALPNAELLLRFAPLDFLNPRRAGRATTPSQMLAVADLETDYETAFGSLSDTRGVTLKTDEVQSNINFIAGQPGTGNFNLNNKPILNNPLGITQVSFESLEYDTTVPLPGGNRTFHVSGGLLLPQGITKSQLKGVLVYFHGTTFSKAQVPSNYGANVETQLMAEVFASQGYAVVMPDYVGQGVDWQDVHPYVVYPTVSAQTATDMLTAVKSRLTTSYGLLPADPALKLFSVGYSEGGAYSLWFNQYLSSNPSLLDPLYKLTHSVGLEGAYDLSGSTFSYLFDDVSFANNTYQIQNQALTNLCKPTLSADVFLSYAEYSLASAYTDVFQSDFFVMKATRPVPQAACNFPSGNLNIAQAFAQQSVPCSNQIVASALGKSNNGSSYPGPLTLLSSDETRNSAYSLVSTNLKLQSFIDPLEAALSAADVNLSAVANQGVTIVSLQQDSVVTPNNFDVLLQRFPTKIRNSYKIDQTQLLVVSPASSTDVKWVPTDHLHALIYEFLYALNTFNQF